MSSNEPIQWGRVILYAFLAALLSMCLIYILLWILGQAPGGDFYGLCPHEDCNADSIGEAIACALGQAIACVLKIFLFALLLFLPVSALIAFLLVKWRIPYRQTTHIILVVAFSIVFAFLLLIVLNLVLG